MKKFDMQFTNLDNEIVENNKETFFWVNVAKDYAYIDKRDRYNLLMDDYEESLKSGTPIDESNS